MALPKKGLRKITIDDNQFVWKVRKKISWEEKHDGQLGIPIQHIDGGQMLIVYVGFSRSYFSENNEFAITPVLIAKSIRKAIDLGWKYKDKGQVFILDCSDLVNDDSEI